MTGPFDLVVQYKGEEKPSKDIPWIRYSVIG
jgi:hypothetical protein